MSDNDIEFNVPKIIKKSRFPKKDLQSAPFVPQLTFDCLHYMNKAILNNPIHNI